MGRVQTEGEEPSRPLSPSRLPLRSRETSGYEADSTYDCVNMVILLLKLSLHLFFQLFILNVTQLCCYIIVVVIIIRGGVLKNEEKKCLFRGDRTIKKWKPVRLQFTLISR